VLAPYLALLLVVAGLAWYAVGARGDESQQPRLHDSGVWVVNDSSSWFGRLDKSIDQLDAAYFAPAGSGDLDVVQEGAAVVGVSDGQVSAIDPATIDVPDGDQTSIPAGAGVDLRGGTFAVADPAKGMVWATRVDPVTGRPQLQDLTKSKPVATLAGGAGTRMVVTEAGTVLAFSPTSDTLVTVPASGLGFAPATTDADLGQLAEGTTITAVGERAVLLQPDGTLRVVGGPTAHVPSGAVLQQPGPDSDSVLVGTSEGLLEVGLVDGKVTTVGKGSGTPVAPVRLGPCEYAAWAGSPSAVLTRCDGTAAQPQDVATSPGAHLVFRVNRGQIVLNDTASGEVWGVDAQRLTTFDDWQTFQLKDKDKGKSEEQDVRHGERPTPVANDDRFGVRPGRETIVHPLDNDFVPQGRLLTITGVSDVEGATVQVSPDGQLLQVALAGSGPASLRYTIDDGDPSDKPSTARIRLDPAQGNRPPELRPHATDPKLYVAAGGQLDVPVLRDWRDPDGDALVLDSAKVGSDADGTVRPLEGGILRFTAPAHARVVRLTYAVGDGRATTPHSFSVTVQDDSSTDAHAPTAAPDVVSGAVGTPIEIHPLANDLAGSDPGNPTAQLALNGEITPRAGTSVDTDEETGTVTFTAESPQSYLLDYTVGFGDAPLATGLIRVDVHAATSTAPPLTMPDTASVYDARPTVVDAVANDTDPAGQLLTVLSATPADPTTLSASVVDGRWVRLVPIGNGPKGPQTVSYEVSDGAQTAEGQILVTPRPEPADPSPVTAADEITVRAGSSVTVPVLDNDVSPTGDTLHLDDDVTDGSAGSLPVEDADGRSDPARVGRAFVADQMVRYLAPASADGDTFTVDYVASDSQGNTAPGELVVTVQAASGAEHDPTPPRLDGRVTAGGTIRLVLPAAGADPDGDPVSITDIAAPPELGRVVDVRGDSILYQAYPDSAGTDQFQYVAADDRGGTKTGTVRVGIVGQQMPQPPQAVPDELSAAPGRTVSVDVTANDHVDQGDAVKVSVPGHQPGISSPSADSSFVDVTVPDDATGDVTGVYDLSDGAGSTTSTVTVHVQKGYDNPPVVDSVFAAEGAGERVTVDLLQNAYDPDGSSVRVVRVDAPRSVATLAGSRLTVTRGARPRIVPFEVADSGGGVAAASVYVPARTVAVPEVKDSALIELPAGSAGAVRQSLASYARSTGGGSLTFTLKDRVWASPEALDAEITGARTFSVRSDGHYTGPGAVSFEVTTGRSATDPAGTTRVITVPVQVGQTRPVLTCPTDGDPVEITQGARLTVPVSTLCHVWTADPAQADEVSLRATTTGGRGLHAATDGQDVKVTADQTARRTDASLRLVALLGSTRSAAVDIPVQIVAAKPPTLAPVDLRLRAGTHRVVDLAPYFTAGVQGGVGHVVSVGRSALPGLRVTRAGGSRLEVSVAAGTSGKARVTVVVSDIAGGSVPAGRRADGRLSFEVLDRPDAPAAPVPGVTIRSHEVHLSWRAPDANGSPIDRYLLTGAGKRWTCRTTTCDATGVPNHTPLRFRVSAHNALGWSKPSPLSRTAKADEKPGQVGPVRVTSVGDRRISLAWSRPTNDASLSGYVVRWPGGARRTTKPQITVTGLSNNAAYSFTVQAYNELGGGPRRSSPAAHSVGTPARVGVPNVQDQAAADDNAVLQVSWSGVSANGPGPVSYTLLHNGSPVSSCRSIRATSCRVGGIYHNGKRHVFAVRATNAGVRGVKGGAARSSTGASRVWDAVGTPAPWGNVTYRATGKDYQVSASFTVPHYHGASHEVTLHVDGTSTSFGKISRRQDGLIFSLPDNSEMHNVWWQVCNEHNQCSRSSREVVGSYGPIRAKYVIWIRPRQRGHLVSWHVKVFNNGRPVHAAMATSVNDANIKRFGGTTHGRGYFDWVTRSRTVDFGKTVKFKITLSDPGRPGRGTVTVRSSPYVPRKGKTGSG